MSVVLENVTKVFEDAQRPGGVVTAVDGMSLEVKDGELVTLLALPAAARPLRCGWWRVSSPPPRAGSSWMART